MNHHFNYQTGDRKQFKRVLEKAGDEKGVTKVSEVNPNTVRIEYDGTLTNMGILIKVFKGYRKQAGEETAR